MNENLQLISSFYEAFQHKDYKKMQQVYSDDATFSDPVFRNLNADQVRAMWEMFCINGKELEIEYRVLSANEYSAKASWKAKYIFSSTGKKVVNHIKSNFILKEGKIIKHTDHFNFYRWAGQALGMTGILLGWTPIVKKKVRLSATKALNLYMKRNR